jgi:HAD superfamily hydrolase (TIGR01490 family)
MKRVAIFDFDHTLITGDSFMPYLAHVAGKARTGAALAEALLALGWRQARGKLGGDARSFIKDRLLRRLLAGRRRDHLRSAAIKTRLWQKENEHVMRRLRDHHAKGDVIVIASGGLDLYLPELLLNIPHDALICTDIGVRNGIVTGDMINGNCVRLRKAARVAQWLADNGPFDESYGYGNYPHDVPMMNLVKHRIIVS